jgi:hypothetical protein
VGLNAMCHKCGEDAPPAASASWVGGKVARAHVRQETVGVTTTYNITTTYSEVAPFEVRICLSCLDEAIAEVIRDKACRGPEFGSADSHLRMRLTIKISRRAQNTKSDQARFASRAPLHRLVRRITTITDHYSLHQCRSCG